MFVEIVLTAIVFMFIGIYCILTKLQFITCDSNVCLNGKTALVTGGNKGLGYEIVLQLASRGCKVIIAARGVSEDLRKKIIKETRNPNVIMEYVDFSSFASVRNLAGKLKTTESKLDILINNAGVGKSLRTPTEDGHNRTMQVNHYSTFLLTHLLVDLLKKSENGKILFTSSFLAHVHVLTRRNVSRSGIPDAPLGNLDYSNSKFCSIISAEIFASKLKKWNINSNCYQPGIAKTEIFKETRKNLDNLLDTVIYFCTMHLLQTIFGVNPKLPSQTAVQIVIGDEFEHVTGVYVGKYFKDLKPRGARDDKLCEAIWKASEAAVRLKPEEKLG
ncbi:retinol dehydrogenase 13-like isoform X1 [Diorhabda carinulata]|uniref:retinol dehydrogenase 13-like isoform X1 n=1 Tax=Diorhabda carinulata TaxID=1163345 RepID=UPI0025A30A8A|nr:retinol dehydrogenase 13-like isoform X1 [Diorhabda carinulata]